MKREKRQVDNAFFQSLFLIPVREVYPHMLEDVE
jgi:hypothetical protein